MQAFVNYYVQMNSGISFVVSIFLSVIIGILLLNDVEKTMRGILRKFNEIIIFLILAIIISCALLTLFDSYSWPIRYANKIAIVIVLGLYAIFYSNYRGYAKITIISIIFSVQTYVDAFSLFTMTQEFAHSVRLNESISALIFIIIIGLTALFIKRYTLNTTETVPHGYWMIVVFISIFSELCFEYLDIYVRGFESFTNLDTTFLGKAILGTILYFFNLLTFYLFYTLTSSYTKRQEIELLQTKQKRDIEEMERLSKSYDELRIIRHEFKNNMLSLKILLDSGNNNKLKSYIRRYIAEYENIIQNIDCGNNFVDRILNYKTAELASGGIDLKIDASLPDTLPFEERDLASLLVNLIDNAAEASKSTDSPTVNLSLHIKKKYFIITVINSVNGNILIENPELKTTKDDKAIHGIGLKVVKTIVDKYNGHINFEQQDDKFVTSLMLLIN